MICGNADRATNVTICITSVVVYVIGNYSGAFAYVTFSIASVIPHVFNRAFVVTTGHITQSIASVIENVGGLASEFAAYGVTIGVASVIEIVRNFSYVIAFRTVTVCIAGIVKEVCFFGVWDPLPSSNELYVVNNLFGKIPRSSVFERPAGELIAGLFGVDRFHCRLVYRYSGCIYSTSANRIKGYNKCSACVSLVEDAKAQDD